MNKIKVWKYYDFVLGEICGYYEEVIYRKKCDCCNLYCNFPNDKYSWCCHWCGEII